MEDTIDHSCDGSQEQGLRHVATTVEDSGQPIVGAILALAVVELMLIVSHVVACYATGKCFMF